MQPFQPIHPLPIQPIVYATFAIAIVVMAAKIIVAVAQLAIIARNNGLRAVLDYVLRPIEFRERQREKIRAGFRRNRRPRASSDSQGLWCKRDGKWQYVEWQD